MHSADRQKMIFFPKILVKLYLKSYISKVFLSILCPIKYYLLITRHYKHEALNWQWQSDWETMLCRSLASVFPRIPGSASSLWYQVLWLLVGVRGGVLHHTRHTSAWFLRRHAVLLHAVFDSVADREFLDHFVYLLLTSSWQVSAAPVGDWWQFNFGGNMRNYIGDYIWRQGWRARLDAQLGAQRYQLVLRLSRRGQRYPDSRWYSISDRRT